MSAENIVNTGAQVSPENIALMANRQTQTRTAHGRAEAREEARVHSEMLGRGSGRGSGAWGVRPVPGSREKPRLLPATSEPDSSLCPQSSAALQQPPSQQEQTGCLATRPPL